MRKNPYFYAATALSLAILSLPAITSAQDNDNRLPPPGRPLPTAIQQRLQNAENNYEQRVQRIEDGRPGWASTTRPEMMRFASTSPIMWREGSSTRPFPIMTPLLRRLASSSALFSSTTIRERLKDIKQNQKDLRLDLFAWKQGLLVQQLTRALDNLKQIRTRIAARIDKEATAGRDMTDAKNKLVTADADITVAGTAIQALTNYTPPTTTSGQLEASTTVNLDKPRGIGADAIKAVNDARKALNDVVRSIAESMGLKLGQDADHPTASSTTQ